MNFPDRIFAVGGAGKAIALKLLESDWVLREVLTPRPNPPTLTVTVIDTAEGEENTDRRRIQSIRERISELEEELRSPDEGRTGTIDVEYKLITEDIHLSGSIDLIGDEAVPRITAGNGMAEEDWWVKENHINENLDFAKGVVRKRGLGKGLYYKAYAEDDEISSYIDLPDKGKVALLVGLGGGTGSGIMIDLARHLQEKQRTAEITLFGILPNHTEGLKENTNAYAALAELEYNALTGDQVFKDRILVPIDPTKFDGKTGNRIQTKKFLQELDEAVIYLLGSYYNTQNLEDPFADSPEYAPFTIGIPQVLRYNVQAINEARDRFRDVLATKEDALADESEIYSAIERFLTTKYGEDYEEGLRDLDKTDLTERLEDAEAWLNYDLFNELDYHSLEVFEDIIHDARTETDDISRQVEIISGSIRAVDTTGGETGTFVDNIDEHLAQVMETDLRQIARRKRILEWRKIIDDNRIRDAVEYLLGIGNSNAAPGVKLQRLEAKRDEVRDQRDRVESDLEDTREELEAVRDEQSAEIQRLTQDWMQDIREDVEQLQRIDLDVVESLATDLSSQLERLRRQVDNADHPDEVDQIEESDIYGTLDELQGELDKSNVPFSDDRQAITASVTALKRARTAFIQMNQEESTFENIAPWQSSTKEEQQEAQKDYQMQKNKLDNDGVFQLGTPTGTFSAELTWESSVIHQQIRERRHKLESEIVSELQHRVEVVPEDLQSRLEDALEAEDPDTDDIEETARQVFRLEVGETDKLEAQAEELDAELDDIDAKLEVYEPAIELFQSINNRRDAWSEKDKEFRRALAKHDEAPEHAISGQTQEYVYVKSIKPEDVFRATGNANIAESDLFSNKEENQRLRGNLEELAKNARNQQYNGLYRRKLSKDGARYNDLKVRVAVTSQAIDQIDTDAIDFEDMFRGAFDLGASGKRVESPFTTWRKDIGGPWDIGLSVFVTGVFLDNIRKVVQADGYQAGYGQFAEELGDDILVHHSFGLEDGYYVRRKKLLNLEDPTDAEFYLQEPAEIREGLLTEYLEKVDNE